MLSDPSATSAPLSLAQSADDTAGAAAARAAMVARLEECGALLSAASRVLSARRPAR